MNTGDLQDLMDTFSGGSEGRTRHAFNRRFIYTEGVKAVADAVGAYWLLDIIATEVAPLLLKRGDDAILKFVVKDDEGDIIVTTSDDKPPVWQRSINYTDFPEGEWVFELAHDGLIDPTQDVLVMLLLEEH